MQPEVWNLLMMGVTEKTFVNARPGRSGEDDTACAGVRVLVIEDEVRLRKLLVRQLSAEGFEV
jgi:hypothetical protein